MEIFAGLSVAFLILAALIVSSKTFALWRRTHGLPEILLSAYLACATVLGYPLVIAASQIPPKEMWLLSLGGSVVMQVGFVCLLLFTRKVFRPGALWAWFVIGAALVVFGATDVAYYIELRGENPRSSAELLGITLSTSVTMACTYLWTMVESLSYYRRLRLRLRLGIGDVLVANRVLLWGLMALAAGFAVLVSLGGLIAGSFLSPSIVFALSSLGCVHAGCLFLAFHPPTSYKIWLEGRGTAAAS